MQPPACAAPTSRRSAVGPNVAVAAQLACRAAGGGALQQILVARRHHFACGGARAAVGGGGAPVGGSGAWRRGRLTDRSVLFTLPCRRPLPLTIQVHAAGRVALPAGSKRHWGQRVRECWRQAHAWRPPCLFDSPIRTTSAPRTVPAACSRVAAASSSARSVVAIPHMFWPVPVCGVLKTLYRHVQTLDMRVGRRSKQGMLGGKLASAPRSEGHMTSCSVVEVDAGLSSRA